MPEATLPDLLDRATPDELAELLRARGFRAELQPGPVIASATGGIGFRVEFGNRAEGEDDARLDFAYVAVLEVPAGVGPDFVARWNAGRRYARLQARDGVLLLDMDVLLAGGVTAAHVQATLEIWDRLLQLLVAELRAALPA